MKILFCVLMLLGGIALNAAAQNDMERIRQEYEKMLTDPHMLYGKNKDAGKYYSLRGIRMYAETYGQGEPLLFIHGNGGAINNFLKQIPFFEKQYKVIVADSRAQGRTVDTGDSLTYEMMADDYAALLDAMHIDSAYVVGWSDGGINGLLLSMRHPSKVKKLAITGANLRPDHTAVFPEVWDLVRPAYLQLQNKKEKNEEERNSYKLLRLLMEQPNIPPASLENVQCPTLVIGGDFDVIRETHTMEIFQHIPRAYLWILPNSGHSTAIVYAEEFNKKIDNFFKTPYRKFDAASRFY